jgi:hypothetical protein
MGYTGDRTAGLVPIAVGLPRLVARSIVAAFCNAANRAARPTPHYDCGVINTGAKSKVWRIVAAGVR